MKKIIQNTYLLAILSGLLLAVSWPTYGFPICLFVAFVPLLLAEKKLRTKGGKTHLKILVHGYLAFVIWNALTTWWLYYASGFGMLFAVLVNSLLMSLLFWAYHWAARRTSTRMSLLFWVCLWLSFEKFHLIWEFSWPWLNLGHGFAAYPKWIQWYEYTGSFGGSLWVLVVNAWLFDQLFGAESKKGNSVIWGRWALMVAIPILISMFIYTSYQIKGTPKEVILLQPNVDPYTEKYETPNFLIAKGLLQQAEALRTPQTEFVIAPETVLAQNEPYEAFYASPARYLMQNYVAQHPKIQLLWGIDTYEFIQDSSAVTPASNQFRPGLWVNFYNAALLVNQKPEIQKYYKSKLVVGIENLPYKSILEPLLGNIMLDLGGTISTKTTQKDRTPLTASDGTRVASIICYESVYGDYVSEFVKNGADFLAVITNDAWWNETQGHKQHLTFSVLRAIENRRDVARSANTGISAFINQRGDITSATRYGEKAALRGVVHLNSKMTFYTFCGDIIAYLAFFFTVLLALYLRFSKKKKK